MLTKKNFLLLFFLVIFCSFHQGFAQDADTAKIRHHLEQIINTPNYRAYPDTTALNYAARYIHDVFGQYSDNVNYQNFNVRSLTFKNVIASFGTKHKDRLIIGAHYDVCGDQDGADDNASGTVGLLELARMLSQHKWNCRIDLVAYSLEEPPFFRTENMGSYIHAQWLHENQIEVNGMICLEMIGYFDESKKSQDYPLGLLKLFYGSKGDYITVVRKFNSGKFARQFKRGMKKEKHVKTKSFQAPGALPGIDFSDHLNYWKFGYSAVMVTNTGFYRNKNYHQSSDQIHTLDISKMAGVIQNVFETVHKRYAAAS
jgi:hypothetical protein